MLKKLFARLKRKQEKTIDDVNAFEESEKKRLGKEKEKNEI